MTEIFVKTQFEGFHHWPEAPNEVAFLRGLHRHVFHVVYTVKVTHEDRQLEFFIVQRQLNQAVKLLQESLKQDPRMSCEMMAKYLCDYMITSTGLVAESVTVSEDGENGAIYSTKDLNGLEQCK